MTETRDFPVAVIASISTGVLLCKFSDMHEAAEYLMGHPIWTHHFGSKSLWLEMQKTILEQCPGMPTEAPGITKDNWPKFVEKLVAEFGADVKIRKGGGLTAMLPTDEIPGSPERPHNHDRGIPSPNGATPGGREVIELLEMPVRKMASISGCGTFRYRLTRYWGPGKFLPFVMLNPSTADAEVDDPTIRRCMSFARREGAGGVLVGNLCAFRSPSPAALDKAADPFGPGNQDSLWQIAAEATANNMPIVCAWGVHGAGRGDRYAVDLFQKEGARLVCLGTTAAGHPKHPLYVKGDQPFVPFPAHLSTEKGS